MRLRIIDTSTKWFWFVIFYNGVIYEKPVIELFIYKSTNHYGWFSFWKWELIPLQEGYREKAIL